MFSNFKEKIEINCNCCDTKEIESHPFPFSNVAAYFICEEHHEGAEEEDVDESDKLPFTAVCCVRAGALFIMCHS